MKARVGRLVGIAESRQIDGVFFDSKRKQRPRDAVQADGQAGVTRKCCAIGIDGHGDDLPGGRMNRDGCAGGLQWSEAKLRRPAGV